MTAEADPLLRASTSIDGDTATVAFAGEVDMTSSRIVRETISAVDSKAIEIDLSAVTFMDSSGLSALVGSVAQLEAENRRIRVVATSPSVDRLFDVAGVDEILRPSREAG